MQLNTAAHEAFGHHGTIYRSSQDRYRTCSTSHTNIIVSYYNNRCASRRSSYSYVSFMNSRLYSTTARGFQ
jgi:hypothetical protein